MVRTSDRIIVLGLLVIGMSIIGLFALLQHHKQHAVEPAWSSLQQASVVTGAIGSSTPTANVDSENASSGEGEDIDAGRPGTGETASSFVGPDAGDELDTTPREEHSQTSRAGKRAIPPTTTRAAPTITQQPRRPVEHMRAAPQSIERAASAPEIEPRAEEIGQAESLNRDATLPVQPAIPNPAPPDATAQPAMPSRPDPVAALPPSPATPQPKSRQDVQDELRNARLNGSLPRFGNPDPYGPGGSPSAADR